MRRLISQVNSSWQALRVVVVSFAIGAANTPFAHEGKPHTWHDLWRSWSFEPVVVVSLLLTAALFLLGLFKVWRHSGTGKGIRRWEALAFAGGWFALFVSLVSPVHAWGRVLFSAHMTQHEILMLVAAPLLVLSEPLVPIICALPLKSSRRIGKVGRIPVIRRVWRCVTIPLVAWTIHAVALWVWHIP